MSKLRIQKWLHSELHNCFTHPCCLRAVCPHCVLPASREGRLPLNFPIVAAFSRAGNENPGYLCGVLQC
ncbi:hypothetical protein AV530_013381 [Patagioenas fasciata monilis]|uniref:Uncharacterized protein n=1 Tax=Patagioenas fasciata monilis TaxID=372326 RepID=A0A1V4JP75_PATFA|nr:hypothetical protein AV530_013381 [Patagioenas fasciata monilis]